MNLKRFLQRLVMISFILGFALMHVPCIVTGQTKDDVKQKKQSKERRGKGMFRDSLDNKFDVSKWMTNLAGFLPLPTIITEPAVGYGGNLTLVFFHPTKQSMDKSAEQTRQLSLPSMTVAGGLYTANNTWAVYGGHYGSYRQDRLRIGIFTAWTDINLNFFLTGPLGREYELKFNFEGLPIYLSAAHKLGKSKWYAGINYFFYRNDITLITDIDIPRFDSLAIATQLGTLGFNLYRQDFDNSFTPNKGTKFNIRYGYNDTWLGSDFRYDNLRVEFLGFGNWVDPWVIGLRVGYEGIFGDFPFYVRPFVGLRGIPVMRYQGDNVLTLETEQRFDITERWAVDGFVGFGLPFDNRDQFSMANARWAGGGGFRYLLARWFGLYMGIDVAIGPLPDDWAWYIIFGSYWLGR
jgi:hypothetical protein